MRDPLDPFPYVEKREKNYLRAALEVIGVIAVGEVDYLLNTQARGGHLNPGDRRWDLRYDWQAFRGKLDGDNWHLDTNHFNTNYVSHPFAGTMYYTAARANHLSVFESFGYSAVAALGWEYFGELREEVSVNDAFVTPVAGMAIGETLTQLGGFFQRGRPNVANRVLAFLIAPAKVINDYADGSETLRATDVDSLGLPRDDWHRFDLFAGGGTTVQRQAADGRRKAYGDLGFGIDTTLVKLPGYAGAARRSDVFTEGNWSHLHFEAAESRGHLADAVFGTEFLPAGYYLRDARADAKGRVWGHGLIVGLRAAFEYGVHDYDRDGARPLDIVAILSPLGAFAEYTRDVGKLRVQTRLEVGGGMAGVQSYALKAYRRSHPDTDLQTVLKLEGYYHAFEVTAAPSVSVAYGPVEIGGRARVDSFLGIEGLDEMQDQIVHEIPLADQRLDLGMWTSLHVPGLPWVLSIRGRQRGRFGDVGSAHASQSESTLWATFGVTF